MKWLFYSLTAVFSLMIGFSSCSKPAEDIPKEENKFRDTSFIAPDGPVWHAVIQQDGKIVVAGSLSDGTSHSINLARFSSDGVVDPTFNSRKDNWNYHDVNTLSLLNGGKVLIGGRLVLDGNVVPFLCFNADGSLDRSFVSPTGINEPERAATAFNGKIFMVGAYRYSSGVRKQFVIRLNADGQQEAQMQVGDEFGTLANVLPTADGKVLVMGNFGHHEGIHATFDIVRLNANLTVDPSFTFDHFLEYKQNVPGGVPKGFLSAAVQADGKIVVIGDFISYQNLNNPGVQHPADGVLRLHTNGTIDGSFQTVNGSRGSATDVEVLQDNRILVTRTYAFDLAAEPAIIYTITGARDATFSLAHPESTLYGVMKQSEKKYLIWGAFAPYSEGMWRVEL